MTLQKASVYFSATRMLMVSPHLPNAPHKHSVIQITFSLEGYPFEVWTEGGEWQTTEAVIIGSNILHSLKEFKGWQVTCCIYPTAEQGKLLQRNILKGADIRYLNRDSFLSHCPDLLELREKPVRDAASFVRLTNGIYDCLLHEPGFRQPIDDRILQALRYIQSNMQQSFSAEALAQAACLSQDRFLHLFKEQVGVPLRQYILCQRMAYSFKLFMEGCALKEAAFEAGFSDAAHFTRTFVQINGITPSTYADLKSHFNFDFFLH